MCFDECVRWKLLELSVAAPPDVRQKESNSSERERRLKLGGGQLHAVRRPRSLWAR